MQLHGLFAIAKLPVTFITAIIIIIIVQHHHQQHHACHSTCVDSVWPIYGRYGHCLWPILSVADMVVADMVCCRYRRPRIIYQGLVGFTEVTGQRVTRGAVWERRPCTLTGGIVFTGCSSLLSCVTKPRPIGILVMVEVKELRDPAACCSG